MKNYLIILTFVLACPYIYGEDLPTWDWQAIRFQTLSRAHESKDFDQKKSQLDQIEKVQSDCFVELKVGALPSSCMAMASAVSQVKLFAPEKIKTWSRAISRLCLSSVEAENSVRKLRQARDELPNSSDCQRAVDEKIKKLVYTHPELMAHSLTWPSF